MSVYIVSQDKSGAYYCHHKDYPYIPVFGSIGDKKKAMEVCRLYNRDLPKKGKTNVG